MNTNLLLFNESMDFQLNDEKHFCAFAQFSPLTSIKTFVKFPKMIHSCSCTLRYLYRHIDKSFLSMDTLTVIPIRVYMLLDKKNVYAISKNVYFNVMFYLMMELLFMENIIMFRISMKNN